MISLEIFMNLNDSVPKYLCFCNQTKTAETKNSFKIYWLKFLWMCTSPS